jgi:hypothetical protein
VRNGPQVRLCRPLIAQLVVSLLLLPLLLLLLLLLPLLLLPPPPPRLCGTLLAYFTLQLRPQAQALLFNQFSRMAVMLSGIKPSHKIIQKKSDSSEKCSARV